MKPTLAALIVTALLAIAGAATAHAAPPVVGSPIQLSPPSGCIAAVQTGACTDDPFNSFSGPLGLEISPDGADVYVANQTGSVGRFRRDPKTNVLTPAGTTDNSGIGVNDLAVSATGTRVAVASGDTSGDGRIEWFSRSAATGALSGTSCADEDVVSGCTEADGIGGANDVALPPSGGGIYVVGEYGAADGPDADSLGDGSLAVLSAGPFGILSQLRCVPAIDSNAPGDACDVNGNTAALDGVTSVVVSPDGAHVYAGGFGGIVGYNRTASGDLGGRVACLARLDGNSACPLTAQLPSISTLAFSPDGRFLYAGSFGTMMVLERNPLSGALSVVDCYGGSAGSGCPGLGGFVGAQDIAVSPDGAFLYTVTPASGSAHGYVQALRRDPATGKATPLGCISDTGTAPCAAGAGLLWIQSVAVSPDGRGVYAAALYGSGDGDHGALTSFSVSAAPSCDGATVSVAAGAAVALPLTCSDANGDVLTRHVVAGPQSGSLGTIDDAGGTLAYTAAAGASRTDTVVFSASDGTNESPKATVTINIAGVDSAAASAGSTTAPSAGTDPVGTTPASAVDKSAPHARIARTPRVASASKLRSFRGTASDKGSGVARVEIAVVRVAGKARVPRAFIRTKGTGRWTVKLRKPLRAGSYVLYARAVDRAGNVERKFSAKLGNRLSFRVR